MKVVAHTTPLVEPVNSFCAAVCIGRTRFYEDLNAGYIQSIKIGRKRLIPVSEREAYLRRMASKGT